VANDDASPVELHRLAEHGDTDAQSRLGALYYNGEGVPQDYAAAAKWFRLAAEQGNPEAQNNLGMLYADGTGVTQDKLMLRSCTACVSRKFLGARIQPGELVAFDDCDGTSRGGTPRSDPAIARK
jgi:TPR repeat protein